jgi:hypothetical protein
LKSLRETLRVLRASVVGFHEFTVELEPAACPVSRPRNRRGRSGVQDFMAEPAKKTPAVRPPPEDADDHSGQEAEHQLVREQVTGAPPPKPAPGREEVQPGAEEHPDPEGEPSGTR